MPKSKTALKKPLKIVGWIYTNSSSLKEYAKKVKRADMQIPNIWNLDMRLSMT